MSRDFINELTGRLFTDGFLDRFLSGKCPLLCAAQQAIRSGRQQELTKLLEGEQWTNFANDCDACWGEKYLREQRLFPSAVLNARCHVVLAALGEDATAKLRVAVELYQMAISYKLHSELKDFSGDGDSLQRTAIYGSAHSAGKFVVAFPACPLDQSKSKSNSFIKPRPPYVISKRGCR